MNSPDNRTPSLGSTSEKVRLSAWDRHFGRGSAAVLMPKPEGWLTAPDVLRTGLAGSDLNRILRGWRNAISCIEAGQQPLMGGQLVRFQVFRVYRQGRWCLHADDIPALCKEIAPAVFTPARVMKLVPEFARPGALKLMKRLTEHTLAGREVAVGGQKLRVTLKGRKGPKIVCLHEESVPAFLKAAIVQYDRQIQNEAYQPRRGPGIS